MTSKTASRLTRLNPLWSEVPGVGRDAAIRAIRTEAKRLRTEADKAWEENRKQESTTFHRFAAALEKFADEVEFPNDRN